MFLQIFLFEIRYRLKRPATYIYFLVFFLFAFLSIATGSTPASEKVFHNAPWTMTNLNITFSVIMLLVCSAVMGVPLYRDIEHQTRNYLFSYPITKAGYFWGRFFGSFVFVLLIGSSLSWGAMAGAAIGPAFGWVPAERIGNFGLWNYFQSFFFFGITNLLLASVIFFSLVAVTRNVKVIYTASIFLLIAYLVASFLTTDLEQRELVKLLDPFMINTFDLETRYFTPAEKNSLLLPVTKTILLNRLIWIGVSLLITLLAYSRFSFVRFLQPVTEKIGKRKKKELAAAAIPHHIPAATQLFSPSQMRSTWWQLTKIEFLNIIKDNYFRAILLGGVIFLILDFWIGNTNFSVPDRPLTIFLMDYKNFNYQIFNFIILLFYTGETIHREKTTGFNIINDALPVTNTVFFFSKLCGLIAVAAVLVTIPLVAGVLIQTLKGHTLYQFDVYFTELYLLTLPGFVLMILLSFTVHLLVNNKFAGHGVALLIWITIFLLRNVGNMDYNLFFYFYTPNYNWSDINGLGHFAAPLFWFNLYWLFFGTILVTIAFLFYQRGVSGSFRERWSVAKQRFKGVPSLIIFICFSGWLGTGAYNYYNVSYINNYTSTSKTRSNQALFEKTLKKYENLPQPKITAVYLNTDIYPDERKITMFSKVHIKNKSGQAIEAMHLKVGYNLKYHIVYNGKALSYESPLAYSHSAFNFLKKGKDTANYRIYKLPAAMQPGDSALLEIFSEYAYKGFVNSGYGRHIVYNGTFFDGGIPTFGYDDTDELSSDEQRKKHKLPPKNDEYPPQTDSLGKRTFLFSDDADLIHFEATVSTKKGQLAIAPGYLQKTWTKNDRTYFQYIQDTKIANMFSVISGDYNVFRDSVTISNGNKVNIEIYHQKNHAFNIDRYNAALKEGLEYFSTVYGPFQFRQMRIIEFPRYAEFAQSFPNTVPYSEALGWVADFSDPDAFDYTYFITAHELAHQWWGHQVGPNRTRGSNLIAEALAEYTALLLTERKYGKDNMKRFLKDELDKYLNGRAGESKKENTFINCNRAYQWYNKGSLILYGLRDLIGDQALNTALREFRDSFALKEEPPFPGSDDLYAFIKKHTPDSLRYYLSDTWEKITLYDNRFVNATSKEAGNGYYDVSITISSKKFYADSTGKESVAAMNDYIDIGIFAAESKNKDGRKQTNPLYLQKHKLTPGIKTITIRVKGKPIKAGIDPYNKLIDRIPDDNTGDVD